ncbi:MAG: hypothetical protein J6C75_02385 [Oscillospiraceae bacterium]|nr:hypothetical protein [Oscillospiraceae bacterium]
MNRNKFKAAAILAAANVILIVAVMAVIGAVAFLNPNRQSFSDMEKRALAEKPAFSIKSLASGEYTKALSLYFADTFPARDYFIQAASLIKDGMGFRVGDVKLYSTQTGDDAADAASAAEASGELVASLPEQKPAESPKPQQPQQTTVEAPESEPEQEEDGVRVGSIFSVGGTGYTVFSGSEAMGKWYAQIISAYADALDGKVKVYNIVVPTSIEFNLPERYKKITTPQQPRLENIKNNLSEKVEWVDVYGVLNAHKDEYLFFRTDHHWTSLGAYYAYTQFARSAGFEPVSLGGLEKRTLDNFLGTLYSQTQDSKMAKEPDYVDYYIFPNMPKCYMYQNGSPETPIKVSLYGEYASSYNAYSVFLHGDFPMMVIDTGVKNGKTLAVIKESYGNALIPFLTNNYEKIVVIDQRYLQKGLYTVLEEQGVDELLFINNILAAHTQVRLNELNNLPFRVYTPPQPAAPVESEAAAAEAETELPEE